MTAPIAPQFPHQAPQQQPKPHVAPNPEAVRIARVRRNLERLKQAGAPPEHVQQYLETEQTTPEKELANMPPDAAPVAPLGNVMAGIGAVGATAASGLPGGKMLMGRLRAISPNISYRDALSDIEQSKQLLPTAARIPTEITGAVAGGGGLAKLPLLTSPAKIGAAFGAASEALDAEPDQSLGSRALETVAGGVAGALIPKVAEGSANLVRKGAQIASAPFRLRTPAAQAVAQSAERAQVSAQNYAQALSEGRAVNLATPAVKQFLAHPEVRPIVMRLRELEAFKPLGKNGVSPELLHSVYTAMSDAQSGLKSGIASAVAGAKSASGKTAELKNIAALKDQFLSAVDNLMPSYRQAVAEHAEHSGLIDATKRGADAVKTVMRSSTGGKRLLNDSPEAIEKWLKTASAEERDAFAEAAAAQAAQLIRSGAVPRSFADIIGFGPTSIVSRVGRAVSAGDRVARMTQGKSKSAQIPRLLSPAVISAADATKQR